MPSNDEKINKLMEEVIICRKVVPESIEVMDKISKKYYQQWKLEIDKIDKKMEDTQVSTDLKVKANEVIPTGSTEELKDRMKTTFKVLEIMLENQKSTII